MLNISNIIGKFVKNSSQREIDRLKSTVEKINSLEVKFKAIADEDFPKKTLELKSKVKNGTELEALIPEAFALVREAARRTLGERHYDVQLMGGVILHQGKIAEMKTGEGKTLVSTLPVYLNSLSGKGVHVVTVNDYLAKRDSEWMGQIYKFLGLSVGCITNDIIDNNVRKKNYNCDVTYGTNNEFGFDYLRDNMKYDIDQMVQRDHYYCIVDEVDSILIDEARTPLVISGSTEDKSDQYYVSNKFVKQLQKIDYEIDEKEKNAMLSEKGIDKIEKLSKTYGILKNNNFYDPQNINLVHHVTQALRANLLFNKDTDYIVRDDQVQIIDEFTGRVLEGRRFSDGLHQALEAKENVEIQSENQTLASITYQNYFRLYKKLSGMTGTAMTEAEEFLDIYKLKTVSIPPNKKLVRNDNNDQIYRTDKEKYNAIIKKIEECKNKQQPVLVGTTSIEKSEKISELLNKKNIKHNVLNAKHHEKEAKIIAEAGKLGAITIATNMAGRGTDIQLGGNLNNLNKEEFEKNKNSIIDEKKEVKNIGGLFVVGTERHESRRIDNQLRGRSGRQGDIGESVFFLSLEDDLMRIFGSKTLENVLSKLGLKEGEAITHSLITKSLERAQQKVESHNYDIRKQILRFDDILNDQRKIIYQNRREILTTKDQSKIIEDMIDDYINEIITESIPPKKYSHEWNSKLLTERVDNTFNFSLPIDKWFEEEGVDEEEITKRVKNEISQKLTDKRNKYSRELFEFAEKRVMLFQIDKDWREHLAAMDMLRGSVNLRAMGGRDPFYEYKKESFDYFDEMLSNQNERVLKTLFGIELVSANKKENNNQEQTKRIITKKIGRNDVCPCGSGKKYKMCHGA